MRALITLSLLLAAATAAADPVSNRGRTRDNTDEHSLSADQIERYAAGYYPAIRSCYMSFARTRGATGELAIRLVVHRNGNIFSVDVDAPGVPPRALRKLRGCIDLQVAGWHFPVRKDFTTAILPYYFLYLDIPGAGPQYSCWDPRGCPAKPAARPNR